MTMCLRVKMSRRGGIYSATSSKSFIGCEEEQEQEQEDQGDLICCNDNDNTMTGNQTAVAGSSSGDCSNTITSCRSGVSSSSSSSSCCDYHPSSHQSTISRRRNGVILPSSKAKWVSQGISVEDDHHGDKGNSPQSSTISSTEDGKTHHQKQGKHSSSPSKSCSNNVISLITRNHIIIDRDAGFDSSNEGNRMFLDILQVYYAEMYKHASSCITRRRLVLNIILDDMYSRGFQFLWRENGHCYKIHDDMFILKKIGKELKETSNDKQEFK